MSMSNVFKAKFDKTFRLDNISRNTKLLMDQPKLLLFEAFYSVTYSIHQKIKLSEYFP